VGSCLFRLAQIAAATGDQNTLRSLAAEAAALRKLLDRLPADHPHQSGIPLLEGWLALALGDSATAETALRQCIAVRAQVLGGDHRLTGYARTVLGGALLAQDRFDEAEAELLAGEKIVAAGYGPNHLMTKEARARLAELYERWGRSEQAVRWR
jgi:hypothetical protein